MKQRQLKKLSKKIVELVPNEFKHAWLCKDTGILNVGGELDYWGEGTDYMPCWWAFMENLAWDDRFNNGHYPNGHEFENYPICSKKKTTTINIFKILQSRKG